VVYTDPKGTPIALAGQSYLHVVFRGASAVCPQPMQRIWTGTSVLTPYYPQLLMVSAAGDFEGFGIGLPRAAITSLLSPARTGW
jgi:hypothetical protein